MTILNNILQLSLKSSYVIIFVIFLRFFLKKAPKVFSYALWSIVFVRLIFPFAIESPYSFSKIGNKISEKILVEESVSLEKNLTTNSKFIERDPSTSNKFEVEKRSGDKLVSSEKLNEIKEINTGGSLEKSSFIKNNFYFLVWIGAIGLILLYSLISTLKLSRKLKGSQHLRENIYINDSLETAFVFSLVSPKIFVPAGLRSDEMTYIIRHEEVHIKRGDHLIKFLAFLITCIHCFNPLVWLAYYLMSLDMELSCDERVVREMGSFIKKDYSNSLLAFSIGRKIFTASPIAFGENNIKVRIKNILNYKKPKTWVVILGILLIAVLAVGCLTEEVKEEDNTKSINTELDENKPILSELKNSPEDYAIDLINSRIDELASTDIEVADYRIDRLEKVDSYNYVAKSQVEVWALSYSLQFKNSQDYEKLNGFIGWGTEDNWISKVDDGSFLVFEKEKDKLSYLINMPALEFSEEANKAQQGAALRNYLEITGLANREIYPGQHKIFVFNDSSGAKNKLLLSKPVKQEDGGIWIVERWTDKNGTVYLWPYKPKENIEEYEYFQKLQGSVDQGHETWRLNPLEVAYDYIINIIGQKGVKLDKVIEEDFVSMDDFYKTPVSIYRGYILEVKTGQKDISDLIHLDPVEWLGLEDEERLKELGLDPNKDLPNGYYINNPTNYPESIFLKEDTKYLLADPKNIAGPGIEVSKDDFIKYLDNKKDTLFEVKVVNEEAIEITEIYLP